jgi:hypothetical protein
MNLNPLQKVRTQCRITHREMFAKRKVLVFVDLFHSPLHSLLKLNNEPLSIVKDLFIIKLHNHIRSCRYLLLQEGQQARNNSERMKQYNLDLIHVFKKGF